MYWFRTQKIHGCLASRIATHNSSFLQLDSVFFCIDHILRQILCHAERPPEDAGLHFNQVHNPRGPGIFLLMAPRVSGLALLASAWIIHYFLWHVCHGLGHTKILLLYGEWWCHIVEGEARCSLSICLPVVIQSCAVAIYRASDVWYLLSTVHTVEYGPEAAVL